MHVFRRPRCAILAGFPLLLILDGCSFVHFGRQAGNIAGLTAQNSNLQAENAKLQQELALTQKQGGTLRALLENSPEAGAASRQLAADLNESTRQLAALRSDYANLKAERDKLLNAPLAGTAASGQLAGVNSQMGDTENKLAAALRSFTVLQGENDQLRSQVEKVQTENTALSGQVRNLTTQNRETQSALSQLNTELLAQKEARAKSSQDAETLRTQLTAANERVAVLTAARSASAGNAQAMSSGLQMPTNGTASAPIAQLETSASRARGRAGQSTDSATDTDALVNQLSELRAKVGTLESERAALQRQVAAVATGGVSGDPASTEARLAMALRSYTVLQTENDQLKADGVKIAAEKASIAAQLAASRGTVPASDQVNSLREQLRVAQTQASSLADENARLKASLTPRTPTVAPATMSQPTRPGPGSIEPAPPPPASTQPAQTTHVIAAGDTLAKISRQYYGTPDRWTDILAANRDILRDEKSLIIGRSIRIP